MKKIFLTLVIPFFAISLWAQGTPSVAFAYDNAGNRVSRSIIFGKAMDKGDKTPAKTAGATGQVLTSMLDKNTVKVYPNPNTGQFRVEVLFDGEAVKTRMELRDLKGVLLMTEESNRGEATFDIGDYKSGTYILTVIINGKRQAWKIIKE